MDAVLARGRNSNRALTAVVALVFVLPGIVAVFGGVDLLRADPADVTLGLLCIGGGVAVFVAGMILQARGLRVVEADANGLVVKSKSGQVVAQIRWAEPHDYWYRSAQLRKLGMPVATIVNVRVVAKDGRAIRIDDAMGENAALQEAVERYTTDATFARLWTELASGATVAFGPIALSAAGLRVDGLSYEIAQIRDLRFLPGALHLDLVGRDGGRDVPMKDVPNYRALLRCVAELKRTA